MPKHTIEDFDQGAFVKEIRSFMKNNKISTREFAKLTKSSPTTLQRLTSGENGITIETAKRFLKTMSDYDA